MDNEYMIYIIILYRIISRNELLTLIYFSSNMELNTVKADKLLTV